MSDHFTDDEANDTEFYGYTECPNCAAHFGSEEWEWQYCKACGWPDSDAATDTPDGE